MNEEEIKAIEKVKDAISVDKEKRIVTIYDEKPLFRDQLQTLIDLIDKQQKEIEEKNVAINKMSKDISRQLKEIEKLNFENHMVKKWNEQLDKNCISKDKIREIRDKAEVMDYYSLNDVIDDLSKLIGDYEEDE